MANFFESLYYTDPISIILPLISIFYLLFLITKKYFLKKFNNKGYATVISFLSSIFVARLFITLTSFLGNTIGYILRIFALGFSLLLIYHLNKAKL